MHGTFTSKCKKHDTTNWIGGDRRLIFIGPHNEQRNNLLLPTQLGGRRPDLLTDRGPGIPEDALGVAGTGVGVATGLGSLSSNITIYTKQANKLNCCTHQSIIINIIENFNK